MNLNYHVCLASVYLVVALVSLVQLLISLAMSCRNSKGNRLREILSPTTPKTIYAVVLLAASIRVAYFAAAVSSIYHLSTLINLLIFFFGL